MIKYEHIASKITKKILRGELQPGDRLPSEKDFSEEYDVSAQTINKALSILVSSGCVRRKNGLGSFVAEDIDLARIRSYEIFTIGILSDRSIAVIPGADTVLGKIAFNLQTILRANNFHWIQISEKDGMNIDEKLGELDGLITLGDVGEEMIDRIKDLSLPCVTFHRDYTHLGLSAVLESDFGIEQLINTLAEKGITRYLFVCDDSNKQIYSLRRSAFFGILKKRRLVFESIVIPRADLEGRTLKEEHLARIREYEIILTSNDRTAIQVLHLLEEKGIPIPQELGLCGYDNSFAGRHTHIPLTTIAYDPYEACELLVNAVSDLIYKNVQTQSYTVDSWLIPRSSTP